jgi:single-strand DNA-binding protein
MINRVTLVGNLGADPELKTTPQGQKVAQLRVATTESYKDRDGNRQESTEWHTVVVWGNQAEACGKYLSKGRQVYVEGKLKTRKWTDKEGNDRYSTEVVASDVRFLGSAA